MAEGGGYEAYHVPQQSRRDKLRVFMAQNKPPHHHLPFFVNNFPVCSSFFPLQDPSSSSSSSSFTSPLEFLPSPNNNNNYMNPFSVSSITTIPTTVLKSHDFDFEGRVNSDKHYNVMGGLVGSSRAINDLSCSKSSSSPSPPCSATHPTCLEEPQLLQPCFPMNPNNNHPPFLYSPHNLQNLSSCSEVVPFKPDHHPLSINGQGLSLSLSSHYSNSIHHQNHAGLPLELDLRRNDPTISNDQVTWSGGYMLVSGGPNEVSRSSIPLGPFTGYSSILKGSKFLKPAQQLLEELFSKVRGGERSSLEVSSMDPCIDQCLSPSWLVDDPVVSGNKSRLISMLEEVYKRYRQYYQQIQAVIASFECVSGLANAAPYANSAVCKHFRSLKNAITDQLQLGNKAYGGHRKEDIGPSNHRPLHNSGFIEQRPVWRPQRGLPERAVTVLRTWLFDHFLHPYPTDSDKIMLAKQTGLSRNQVSNWFINARVRLWKPMVEEIHSLEARQAQKDPHIEEQNATRPITHQVQNSNSVASCYPSIPNSRVQEIPPPKCTTELPELPVGGEEPVSLSYDNLSSHPHVGVAVNMVGANSGVSLTLGLHQNDGLGLQESFPLGAISSHWPSP